MPIEYEKREHSIIDEVTEVLKLAHQHASCVQISHAKISPRVALLIIAGDHNILNCLHAEALDLQKQSDRLRTDQDGHA